MYIEIIWIYYDILGKVDSSEISAGAGVGENCDDRDDIPEGRSHIAIISKCK